MIKLRLEPACDRELIEYFQSIPKRRHAEQVRRFLTAALQFSNIAPDSCMTPSLSVSSKNIEGTDDESLFAKDMAEFNIADKGS